MGQYSWGNEQNGQDGQLGHAKKIKVQKVQGGNKSIMKLYQWQRKQT